MPRLNPDKGDGNPHLPRINHDNAITERCEELLYPQIRSFKKV